MLERFARWFMTTERSWGTLATVLLLMFATIIAAVASYRATHELLWPILFIGGFFSTLFLVLLAASSLAIHYRIDMPLHSEFDDRGIG